MWELDLRTRPPAEHEPAKRARPASEAAELEDPALAELRALVDAAPAAQEPLRPAASAPPPLPREPPDPLRDPVLEALRAEIDRAAIGAPAAAAAPAGSPGLLREEGGVRGFMESRKK